MVSLKDFIDLDGALSAACHDERSNLGCVCFEAGEFVEFETLNAVIVFLMEGEVRVRYGKYDNELVLESQFFYIPTQSKCRVDIVLGGRAIICRLGTIAQLNDNCNLGGLVADEQNQFVKKDINGSLSRFLIFLQETCNENENESEDSEILLELKLQELFFYLRAYYTRASIAQFFCPVLEDDTAFFMNIMKHVNQCNTVKQLACKCNLSVSGFTKHFTKSFGISPYKWLKTERSRRILTEIKHTHKTYHELSEDFAFASPAYFHTFCKREFGETPGELRNPKN